MSTNKQNNQEPSPIQHRFIVDDRGHIINKEKHAVPNSAFPMEPVSSSAQTGFSFSPVGYYSFATKPNHIIAGVRPELGDTSPSAHHFLHKKDNEKTISFSSSLKKSSKLHQ